MPANQAIFGFAAIWNILLLSIVELDTLLDRLHIFQFLVLDRGLTRKNIRLRC